MHKIDDVPKSADCGALYYLRQVYWWSEYETLAGRLSCRISEPAKLVKNNWQQTAEKMAQAALIFPDEQTHTSPDDGVRVQSYDASDAALTIENLFTSTHHPHAFLWTLASGWNMAATEIKKFEIFFGKDDLKTVYVWGIQFMKSQLTADFVFTLRIGYHQDTGYTAEEWIHPTSLDSEGKLDKLTGLIVTVTPSSLDEAGIFWLKEGTEPVAFVASRIQIEKTSGQDLLNFDFIGTYYSFDTAKDNSQGGKADNWNSDGIYWYLIKGENKYFILFFLYPYIQETALMPLTQTNMPSVKPGQAVCQVATLRRL